jgi:diguanylate cyclase (GGDEF)-like protein
MRQVRVISRVLARYDGASEMSEWWRRSSRFDAFSLYLRDRGLERRWRWAVFGFTCVLGALPLVVLASPAGPDSATTRAVAITAAAGAFAVSLVWLPGWPSRPVSLLYNAVCCASIAAASLAMSYAYAGLMGCVVFAVLGGYLAYFHGIADVLANFAVAAVCVVISAARLIAETGDVAVTVAAVTTVAALNIGVPFGIHSLVHSLHTDLSESGRDPLTGLLNRRSFYHAVHQLLGGRRAGSSVNVTMIDLDDFKGLNDSRGHAVGDQALAGVGEVLMDTCGPTAVLGRLGGEEFVVADTDTAAEHLAVADDIRLGIAGMPFGITASVGTCTAIVGAGTAADSDILDRLIDVADAAMYGAKRAGGNRVERRHLDGSAR